jgi:hypothetical protein
MMRCSIAHRKITVGAILMNTIIRSALLVLLALVLAACSRATPYQPESASSSVRGGYSHSQIGPDLFRVRFNGNALTSRETVEAYLLYRAAELTIEQGGDWFTVLDRETEHRVTREIRRDPLYRPWFGPDYGAWSPYWSYRLRGRSWYYWDPWLARPFWADGIDQREIDEYEASADIRIAQGDVPADDLRAYDARQVLTDIGPRVVRPKG